MQLVTVSKISQQWNLMKERASEQATVSIPDNDTELKHLRIQGTSARDCAIQQQLMMVIHYSTF
jgi:hypothetical protein